MASAGKVLLTASRRMSCGTLPARKAALSRRCLTACKALMIVVIMLLFYPVMRSCDRTWGIINGNLGSARLLGQEQGLRPSPLRGAAPDDPRERRRAPHQRRFAGSQRRARHGVR